MPTVLTLTAAMTTALTLLPYSVTALYPSSTTYPQATDYPGGPVLPLLPAAP